MVNNRTDKKLNLFIITIMAIAIVLIGLLVYLFGFPEFDPNVPFFYGIN